jgi:hypothetical protein
MAKSECPRFEMDGRRKYSYVYQSNSIRTHGNGIMKAEQYLWRE